MVAGGQEMEKSTTQVLQEARALVEQGWTQGPYHAVVDGMDCYCALGAIYTVVGLPCLSHRANAHRGAQGALDWAAKRVSHGKTASAIVYNEQPGRTKEQVLHLFDVALEIASK
jgi:hypothetical protein